MSDPNDLDIVQEIKRGAWSTTIIDRNGPHRNHGTSERLRYMVRLNDPDGFHTSWPIQHDNGSICYDYPPPRDARRAVEAAYRWINKKVAAVA